MAAAAAAAATQQLGMSASSFMRPSPLATKLKTTPTNPIAVVVCHQSNNTESHSINSNISRRLFTVAAVASATGLGVLAQPGVADAKRNKPAPAENKKAAEAEDKSLSAYDARLLANARRKEAMKASIDKLKAKAT